MAAIDPRIVRVSIEVDGEVKIFEDLEIVARGSKSANALQNACEVTITNLNAETRNYLLTETSPYNTKRSPKRLIVEAGRKSTGVFRLFYGEITSATPTQPPDIGLHLKALTGNFSKGDIIARSGTALKSLKAIAQGVAADLGVSLNFQAKDKQIANYSFTGAALRQVDELGRAGEVNAYVDDETLVVKDFAQPLTNRVRLVNLDTGMVGIPEVTDKGIKVRYLLDGATVLGGTLEVKSKLNPGLDGSYTIYALDFEVANRATPFYYVASGTRPNFKKPATLKKPKKTKALPVDGG